MEAPQNRVSKRKRGGGGAERASADRKSRKVASGTGTNSTARSSDGTYEVVEVTTALVTGTTPSHPSRYKTQKNQQEASNGRNTEGDSSDALVVTPPPKQFETVATAVKTTSAVGGSTKRLVEILHTLTKYGLVDLLGDNLPRSISNHLKSSKGGEKRLTELTRPERFRLALTELGTTYIKLGQILSTRSDLVGPEIANELAQLQSSTPADSPETVRATIIAELNAPPEDLFAEFDYNAMASASIGQVHKATLFDGTHVVVKVQHYGIEQVILDDFVILAQLAKIAEKHSGELRNYRPQALVDNFRRDLLRELDFGRECRSLQRFGENFEDDPQAVFPKAYPDLSSKRVMVMERIYGKAVSHAEELKEEGFDLQDIAHRGANIFLRQIFEHRFYHADPHPGNIFVLKDGAICLLDCGMTGRLDDRLRDNIEEILGAAINIDAERLTDVVLRVATVPHDFDRESFEADVIEFLEEYSDEPIETWDFGALINDFTGIIRRYHIQLPTNVSLLLRMLVELEGTARLLSPSFSLPDLLKPYLQDSVLRKFDPARISRQLGRTAREWDRLVQNVPREISEILRRARQGTLAIKMEHRGMESTINRLIYGVLTASLILGSSQLWSREIEPLIYGQSVPGVICAGGAFVLSTRLLRAIELCGGLG